MQQACLCALAPSSSRQLSLAAWPAWTLEVGRGGEHLSGQKIVNLWSLRSQPSLWMEAGGGAFPTTNPFSPHRWPHREAVAGPWCSISHSLLTRFCSPVGEEMPELWSSRERLPVRRPSARK